MSRQIMASGEKLVVTQPTALSGLSSFTWACWVNPNGGFSSGMPGVLTQLRADGVEQARFRISSASFGRRVIGEVLRGGSNAVATSANLTITLGAWQHLAMTYSETDGVRLYRDGVETNYVSRLVGAGATDAAVAGGLVMCGTTGTLDGRIAEVAIWGRVLTSAELKVLGSRSYSPLLVRAGLLAAWQLRGQLTPEPDALGGPAAVAVGTIGAEHPRILRNVGERCVALGEMRGQSRRMG